MLPLPAACIRSMPVPFPARSQAASQAAHFRKDCGFTPKSWTITGSGSKGYPRSQLSPDTTLPSLHPFPYPSAPTPTQDLCKQPSLQPPTIPIEETPSQIAAQPTSNLSVCLAQALMRATLASSVCSRTRSN